MWRCVAHAAQKSEKPLHCGVCYHQCVVCGLECYNSAPTAHQPELCFALVRCEHSGLWSLDTSCGGSAHLCSFYSLFILTIFRLFLPRLLFIFLFSVSRRRSTRNARRDARDARRPSRGFRHGSKGPRARSCCVSCAEPWALKTRAPDVTGRLLCSCTGRHVGSDVVAGQHDPWRTSQLPPFPA